VALPARTKVSSHCFRDSFRGDKGLIIPNLLNPPAVGFCGAACPNQGEYGYGTHCLGFSFRGEKGLKIRNLFYVTAEGSCGTACPNIGERPL
jgi:hypothetical protein